MDWRKSVLRFGVGLAFVGPVQFHALPVGGADFADAADGSTSVAFFHCGEAAV